MPGARDNLMPIGRFARACRLSIKALRHYDEQGLLAPAHVDRATGYRYYARDQARDAILIGMLRSLGIGIAAIQRILDAPAGAREALLEAEARRIEGELAARQQALQSVRRLAREASLLPYPVALREEPAFTVATRTCATDSERLLPETTALIYALFDELRAAGRPVLNPVLCMNEEPDRDDRIVVHACVALAPPLPELPRARVVELAGGTFAALEHAGPYEELGLAYHALHAWVQARGHEPRGLVREIYLNDPADVAPEALRTELLMPV